MTKLVSVTVPAGSYSVLGQAALFNADNDRQYGDCQLSTGDSERVYLADIGSGANTLMNSLQDAATFAGTTTVTLSCATFKGEAVSSRLTAIQVAGIN
jgi:hypothetical protein